MSLYTELTTTQPMLGKAMLIKHYGQWYFDTKDIVAIRDTTVAEEKQCHVHLRGSVVVRLRGQAAEQCLREYLRGGPVRTLGESAD